MSDKWSRSQTEKVVEQILGIHGRVWVRGGQVSIGLERGDQKLVVATGANYLEAIERAFILPVRAVDSAGGMEKFREMYADPTAFFAKRQVEETVKTTEPLPCVGCGAVGGCRTGEEPCD